jgi:hypothetical protein
MAGLFAFFLVEVVISKSLCNFRFVYNVSHKYAEMQIKKNSCQTLGPASKRALPDLSTFCQTYFFLEIF